jgi:hypothetical protein
MNLTRFIYFFGFLELCQPLQLTLTRMDSRCTLLKKCAVLCFTDSKLKTTLLVEGTVHFSLRKPGACFRISRLPWLILVDGCPSLIEGEPSPF